MLVSNGQKLGILPSLKHGEAQSWLVLLPFYCMDQCASIPIFHVAGSLARAMGKGDDFQRLKHSHFLI